MTPTADHIFLKPIEKKITSLIIPPKYRNKAYEFFSGIVHSTGKRITTVQPGDEIAYAKDSGVTVEINDEKFVIIKPRHIVAVV
jgi:co-chaperonin GroES (HSP10)